MKNIAVIGSGISGISAAWLLRSTHRVTLFEAADRLGGHTNTVNVTLGGITAPVDTGFLVHNDITYPNLIQLFRHLGIGTHPTEMTFSVQVPDINLEWAGTDLGALFAQKRNLLRPGFWRMIVDILRFNRQAQAHLAEARLTHCSLGQLLSLHGYSQAFRDWYLIPMAAAIWSSPASEILDFPAATFITFCLNHHLLQVANRPQWKTVLHGARTYLDAMASELPDIRLASTVQEVRRHDTHVSVTWQNNGITHSESYDDVVFACHAPTTLQLLADATREERDVLDVFRYQPNVAWLHTDATFLPRREKAWAAWNYESGPDVDGRRPVCVSYLINKLQPLPFTTPVMVTLNPWREPAAEKCIQRIEYEHPLFDASAIAGQAALNNIQGRNRAWFCGAWAGYGFHEDGLKSALRVALGLGASAPWPVVLP